LRLVRFLLVRRRMLGDLVRSDQPRFAVLEQHEPREMQPVWKMRREVIHMMRGPDRDRVELLFLQRRKQALLALARGDRVDHRRNCKARGDARPAVIASTTHLRYQSAYMTRPLLENS